MGMSVDAPGALTTGERAGSLARRMLGGAAAAAVVAYRLGESLPFVAHGLTPAGDLVVAAHPQGGAGSVADGVAIDVRMDIEKQSPEPDVPIIAASVHVLGSLTWLSAADARARIAAGGLPSTVSATLETPGARLGLIGAERVVMHDMDGATVIGPEVLTRSAPVPEDEFEAFDMVARYGRAALKDLVWAVMVGEVPGVVVSKGPLPGLCRHTAGRAYCIDVDASGVTVMLAAAQETLIVHAAFAAVAGSAVEMNELIAGLMVDVALLPAR